ncbi:MAG: lipoyl(octanoyl) transferase LipB [Desulfobacterales bacterium]|jgi:lipoate-protein ligase B
MTREWLAIELPRTDYAEVQALQQQCVAAKCENRLGNDLMFLLEHPAVFTLGRNGGRENMMVSDAFLDSVGVRVVTSERGGNITYHGPGQIVGYPVIDLHRIRMGVEDYVNALEELMIAVARQWDIPARRDPRNRGIWVDGAKAGSIGLCLRHGMAFHGFALNVNNDLTPFQWINPCGLADVQMTSLARFVGGEIPLEEVRAALWQAAAGVFDVTLTPCDISDLKRRLSAKGAFTEEV